MTDPHPDDALEGNLAQLTDDQWLTGHVALADTGVFPAGELDFVLDPDLDGAELVGVDETEEAPRDGDRS